MKRKPNATGICRECGISFAYYTYGGKVQVFCSNECKLRCTSRVFRSEGFRRRVSERMFADNPMHRPGIVAAVKRNRTPTPTGPGSPLSKYRWSRPGAREEHAEKMRRDNPMWRQDVAARVGAAMRRKHTEDPEWHRRVMAPALAARSGIRNRHETEVDRIICGMGYGFRFVGTGDCFMRARGQAHSHIPDWIWRERKLVILYHGKFWHQPSRLTKRCKDEEGCYRAMGYSVLVIRSEDVLMHDWISTRGRSVAFDESMIKSLVREFVGGEDSVA